MYKKKKIYTNTRVLYPTKQDKKKTQNSQKSKKEKTDKDLMQT